MPRRANMRMKRKRRKRRERMERMELSREITRFRSDDQYLPIKFLFCYLVERPDPKGLSTFSQCTEFFCRTRDLNSCPPDLELGALTKWLASRC
jgi:hypothetical protein